MGELASKTAGAANKIGGAIKESVGRATGNGSLEAEGIGQRLKGSAQDVKGSVEGALGNDV